MQDTVSLQTSLASAEKKLNLFLNRNKEHIVINRAKKFLSHPFKVIDMALFRAGLTKSTDRNVRMFWGSNNTLPIWDEDAAVAYYTGCLGTAELPLVRFLLKTLTSQDVFYDIGASLGLYTSLAEAIGASVHVFEPNMNTASYIERNAASRTVVNTLALSDHMGKVTFFELSQSESRRSKSGMSAMDSGIIASSSSEKPIEIQVPSTTLDMYTATHVVPTILKIDVLSSENLVLRGARALLAAHSPILSVRIYNSPTALSRTDETLKLLNEFGYSAYSLDTLGSLIPANIVVKNLKFATTFIFKK